MSSCASKYKAWVKFRLRFKADLISARAFSISPTRAAICAAIRSYPGLSGSSRLASANALSARSVAPLIPAWAKLLYTPDKIAWLSGLVASSVTACSANSNACSEVLRKFCWSSSVGSAIAKSEAKLANWIWALALTNLSSLYRLYDESAVRSKAATDSAVACIFVNCDCATYCLPTVNKDPTVTVITKIIAAIKKKPRRRLTTSGIVFTCSGNRALAATYERPVNNAPRSKIAVPGTYT